MSVLTIPADEDVLPNYAFYTLVPCISLHSIFLLLHISSLHLSSLVYTP